MLTLNDEKVHVRGWDPFRDEVFDAAEILKTPNVKSVHIGGMPRADNLHVLTQVGPIEELYLEILNLEPLNLLEKINPSQLRSLTLFETSESKLDLEVLERFPKLQHLAIKHKKNLDAIGKVKTLKSLQIRLTTRVSCDFISELAELEDLTLLLGGQKDISNIACPSLQNLEICRVRGLCEIGDLSRFVFLKSLKLENQPNIEKLIASKTMENLESIEAFFCPKLTEFDGWHNIANLQKLIALRTPLTHPSLVTVRSLEHAQLPL